MCPGFSETNGDSRWPFALGSGMLPGTCSACHGGRQTNSVPMRVTHLGRRQAAPSSSTVLLTHLSPQRLPPWSLGPAGTWGVRRTWYSPSSCGNGLRHSEPAVFLPKVGAGTSVSQALQGGPASMLAVLPGKVGSRWVPGRGPP